MTVYNRIRPSKDDLASLSTLTRKEIAAKYKVAPSTVSKWLSLYQLSAADDSLGGNRKLNYTHGRKPTTERAPKHYKPGIDSEDFGAFVARPPKSDLEEMCKTMTTVEIAETLGTARKRVSNWLYDLKLKAQPMKKRVPSLIEQKLGSETAIIAWISTHSVHEAEKVFGISEYIAHKYERKYGVRFLRTCRICKNDLPYKSMRQRTGGRIYNVCEECFKQPDRPKILNYSATSHLPRLEGEFETPMIQWARVPMSMIEGINGYRWSGMGASYE